MPASTPSDPEIRTISLGLDTLPEVDVIVRRTTRSNVRINVDEAGDVIVSAPPRLAAYRIDAIVQERAGWIEEVLARAAHTRKATEVDLRRGDPVRLQGRWITTRIVTIERGRGGCQIDDEGRLVISLPVGGDPYELLHRWYRMRAREVITGRVERWAVQLGLAVGSISIRDQRTRWGSCTHRGDLSFNWRLLLAPEWVMDAIVVHELCHIEQLNHSDSFWALLDERYPRHREASEWLAEHGAALRMSAPKHDPALRAATPVVATGDVPARRGRGRRRAVAETQVSMFD